MLLACVLLCVIVCSCAVGLHGESQARGEVWSMGLSGN